MGVQSQAFMNGEANAMHHRNKHKKRPDEIVPLLEELSINPTDAIEFGCGDGRRLALIRDRYPHARLIGADPSRDAIYSASQKHSTIKFVQETCAQNHNWDQYDLIIFGFCLYLCDRHEIQGIAANANSMLQDGGYLIIHDFDPEHAHKVPYEHEEGLFSYKMDHSKLWLSNPAYTLLKKVTYADETAVWVLKKDVEAGWPIQTLR